MSRDHRISSALAYDTLGRRTGVTFGDGSTQAYGWEDDDDLSSIAHGFPTTPADELTYGYATDAGGRRTSETISNAAYQATPGSVSQAYGAATGLNTYPSVGGQTVTYWPSGAVYVYPNAGGVLAQDRYDELGSRQADSTRSGSVAVDQGAVRM